MHLRATAFSRFLAFVALFCALGLQAGEAQHSHGIDEQVAECMFCKGSSGPDAAVHDGAFAQPEKAPYQFTSNKILPVKTRLIRPTARGPPTHS